MFRAVGKPASKAGLHDEKRSSSEVAGGVGQVGIAAIEIGGRESKVGDKYFPTSLTISIH